MPTTTRDRPPPERAARPLLHVASDVAWRFLLVALAAAVVVYVLVRLRLVVLPVFVALLVATALEPAVAFLDRAGWPRLAATWAVFGGFLGLLVLAGLLVVPPIAEQFGGLDDALSDALDDVQRWAVEGPLGVSEADLREYRANAGGQLREFLGGDGAVVSGALLVFESLAGALLALVVTFFVVKDGPRLQRWTIRHLPDRHHEAVRSAAGRAWAALGAYVRGAALIGAVEAVVMGVTLAVVGAPLVVAVAVLTFFSAFFPIVGAVAAGTIATLVALVGGGTGDALVVAVVAIVVQQLDNDLLAPVVYGRVIRLHPLVIILSLTAGGAVGGIAGAFIAVPIAAVVAAVGGDVWDRRTAAEPT